MDEQEPDRAGSLLTKSPNGIESAPFLPAGPASSGPRPVGDHAGEDQDHADEDHEVRQRARRAENPAAADGRTTNACSTQVRRRSPTAIDARHRLSPVAGSRGPPVRASRNPPGDGRGRVIRAHLWSSIAKTPLSFRQPTTGTSSLSSAPICDRARGVNQDVAPGSSRPARRAGRARPPPPVRLRRRATDARSTATRPPGRWTSAGRWPPSTWTGSSKRDCSTSNSTGGVELRPGGSVRADGRR